MRGTVVHVIWHLGIGGGEVFLRDLVTELARRGLPQHVLCVGPAGVIAADVERAGVPVTAFHKRTRLGLLTVIRLAQTLRRLRAAVVHTHGEAGLFWGVPAALAIRAPLVTLLYHNEPASRLHTWMSRALLRRADCTVAGSADVARYLRQDRVVPRDRLRVVLCGVATTARGHRRPLPPQEPCLLMVGRLVARKGHRVLIDALPVIRRRHPGARVRVVGDGPLRAALEARARRNGVAHAVEFAGSIYPVASAFDDADVFVFPSITEPQGLSVLDAFAAGVPVVASRTGGIVEMVEHDVSGRLVEPDDVAALAEAVIHVLDDPHARQRYTETAAARLARFDIAEIALVYERVYGELAAAATPGVVASGHDVSAAPMETRR